MWEAQCEPQGGTCFKGTLCVVINTDKKRAVMAFKSSTWNRPLKQTTCPCVQIKSQQRVGPRLSGDKLYPSCPSPQSFFWNLQNSNRNVTSRNQGTSSGEEERGPWEQGCLKRSELVTPYLWIQRNW